MSAGNKKPQNYKSFSPSAVYNRQDGGFSDSDSFAERGSDKARFSEYDIEGFRASRISDESPDTESEFESGISVQDETAAAEPEDDEENLSYGEKQKRLKLEKIAERDRKILRKDRKIMRKSHFLTYIGIFLFTFVLYFRPYEWIPGGSVFSSAALILAVATLVVYLPVQLASESSLTVITTEVKALLAMTFVAACSIIIARSPGAAWEKFNDPYIKVVLIFIVMINVIRNKERLLKIMWLGMGVGAMVSYDVIGKYNRGELGLEGLRVISDLAGMFGNPNDMALHLVMYIPIAVVLGVTAKKILAKIIYFSGAAMFVGGIVVSQSRGAFLALLVSSAFLTWKLGREQRLKYTVISLVIGMIFIAAAPGNYGVRILSIFIPGLDSVGSSNERSELLKQSLIVTLRNPWGIGMGNFPIVSANNLETHNAYTQVSSELGLLGLAAYLTFIIVPLKRLSAMQRQLLVSKDKSWLYYMSVGLQGSIIAYMVASFFAPVAYQWYIYYPIAYAVALRRIYNAESDENRSKSPGNLSASEIV